MLIIRAILGFFALIWSFFSLIRSIKHLIKISRRIKQKLLKRRLKKQRYDYRGYPKLQKLEKIKPLKTVTYKYGKYYR